MIATVDLQFSWLFFFSYLIVYNLTLLVFFISLSYFNFNLISNFTVLNTAKYSFFLISVFFITLSSLGGVPPFAGFFFKVFVLVKLAYINWFILILLLLPILMLSLYFYLQNVRHFLTHKNFFFLHINFSFNYSSWLYLLTAIFFIIFAGSFLFDFMLLLAWLFFL